MNTCPLTLDDPACPTEEDIAMQAAAAHTPGPWHRSDADVENHDRDAIRGLDGALIAFVWQGAHDNNLLSEAEVGANARLIAAAPDLLAALEWALKNLTEVALPMAEELGRVTSIPGAIQRAEEAIRKATA